MHLPSLPDLMLEPLVRSALREDLGRAGDITTDAVIPKSLQWQGALVAREEGTIAGLDLSRLAFHLLDETVLFKPLIRDGDDVGVGTKLAEISGSARAIITGERVALNYLSHLSGIASATKRLMKAIQPYKSKLCCTRKTTPGLRFLEKYAVRAGGGSNHRFGLDDAILIKDNHIAAAGSLREAVERAKASTGHLVKIEVEVDTIAQLEELLTLSVDAVLLDNMDAETLKRAVALVQGKMITEASGRVNIKTINAIAASGVDVISCGAITHSAAILDIGLDAVSEPLT